MSILFGERTPFMGSNNEALKYIAPTMISGTPSPALSQMRNAVQCPDLNHLRAIEGKHFVLIDPNVATMGIHFFMQNNLHLLQNAPGWRRQ